MNKSVAVVALVTVALTSAHSAAAQQPAASGTVRPGLEMLLERPPTFMIDKRLGLITNHAGIDRQGNSNIDLLRARADMKLTTLFAFEHGIRGDAPPGQRIESYVDGRTGLPVLSLYGEIRKPTPEMLRDVDVLLYDVQDSGGRPYTRVSTMALSMQAAKEKGIPFVVLDRPNPLGGVHVEGNVLDTAFASFVGMYPIPLRHGMTLGELAHMYNREFGGIGVDLTVIPMAGWTRETWFNETGMRYIPPSPNLRRLEAALMFPGMVLLEGTNLSEGRGTDAPFEQMGAPWLRAQELADSMNALRLPGIRFDAIQLVIEEGARKYGGQAVPGVRFVVTDRDTFEPVATAVRLIATVRRLHPDAFEWRGGGQRGGSAFSVDRLAGTDRLRKAIDSGNVEAFLKSWEQDEAAFRKLREPYLLYR